MNTQGLRVGKSGEVLQIREKDQVKQEVRLGEIRQLSLMGNIQHLFCGFGGWACLYWGEMLDS